MGINFSVPILLRIHRPLLCFSKILRFRFRWRRMCLAICVGHDGAFAPAAIFSSLLPVDSWLVLLPVLAVVLAVVSVVLAVVSVVLAVVSVLLAVVSVLLAVVSVLLAVVSVVRMLELVVVSGGVLLAWGAHMGPAILHLQ
jgi:hypothetical protein